MGSDRNTGIVKSIVRDRGFGFVRTMSGQEFFFHRTGCSPRELFDRLVEKSTKVSFLVESSDKGPRATDLREV